MDRDPNSSSRVATVERAYQLARSGRCAGINDVKALLKAEGYMDYQGQLTGRSIQNDMRRLCAEHYVSPDPDTPGGEDSPDLDD